MNLCIRSIYKILKNQRNTQLLNHKFSFEDSKYVYTQSQKFFCTKNNPKTLYEPNWTLNSAYVITRTDSESQAAQFIVSYIDTMHGFDTLYIKNQPIVLFLHDCLSSINTFKPLLYKFIDRGYRIIIPSLVGEGETVGITATDDSLFKRQMLGERTIFLIDFLLFINIKKISLVIGHSLSCFILLTMGSFPKLNIQIEKLLFLNPIPGHIPPRWITPVQLSFLMLQSYDYFITRPLFYLWIKARVRKHLIPFSDNIENLTIQNILNILKVTHGIKFDNIKHQLTEFVLNKLPMLSVSFRNDATSDYVAMVNYMRFFNLAPKHVVEYNSLPKIMEEQAKDKKLPLRQFILLPGRSHFPFYDDEHFHLLINEIFQFLDCKEFKS